MCIADGLGGVLVISNVKTKLIFFSFNFYMYLMTECDYDGGDCCGEFAQHNFCSQCTCHSEEIKEEIDPGKTI